MATSIDRLDGVHGALVAASGRQFFQRLRDYGDVLNGDRKIKRAIRRIRRQANQANKRFLRKDKKFRKELRGYRKEFVAAAPDADDSGQPRPAHSGTPAPPASFEGHEWSNTLANFDAVDRETADHIIQRQGLDSSQSGTMAAIMATKVTYTRFPMREKNGVLTQEKADQRPDLDDLHRWVKDVRDRQHHAYLEMEKTLESSGYIGLARIDTTVKELDPTYRPMVTDKEREVAFSAALQDVSGQFHILRQAVRPAEVQNPLSKSEEEALKYHEERVREAVERFEGPLRVRLNRDSWVPQPTTVQIVLTFVAILVAIVIAVLTWLVFTPSNDGEARDGASMPAESSSVSLEGDFLGT